MEKAECVRWGWLVFWSVIVCTVREMLLVVLEMQQRYSFAVMRGMWEFRTPQVDTLWGLILAVVGAGLIITITRAITKNIIEGAEVAVAILGFTFGAGIMAAGVAGSSSIFWLPVAAAAGLVSVSISDKVRLFTATKMLAAEIGMIVGVTAFIALDDGLFIAGVVEYCLVLCYWLGVFAVFVTSGSLSEGEKSHR